MYIHLPFDRDQCKHQIIMASQGGPYIVDTAIRRRHLVVMYSNSQSQLEAPFSCTPSALSSLVRGTSLTLHQPVSSWRAGIYPNIPST